MGEQVPLTVIVLTLDEERNIAACLDSCAGCGDIHVLDSGSRDRTVEIARAKGAQVWTNPFTSFGAQRNWAIDNIPAQHPWQLHLDADERLTPALVAEIRETIAASPAHAGYYLPSKFILMGSWLRRTGGYPTYQMRLFHRDRMRFCDHGHGQREETTGTIGTMREPYLHLAFEKGLDDWFAKHNRYSTLEAAQAMEAGGGALDWGGLFAADRIRRRRALKALSFRLPCRATLRSAWMLLGQAGFLDGRAGLAYIRMMHCYESMIDLKLRLLRRQARDR